MVCSTESAHIEIRNLLGETPLIVTCQEDSRDIILALIEAGANPLVTDNAHRHGVDYCQNRGKHKLARKIIRRSIQIRKFTIEHTLSQHPEFYFPQSVIEIIKDFFTLYPSYPEI